MSSIRTAERDEQLSRASTGAPRPYGAGATNLVCVAATGKNDALAGFSNRGKSAVHLAAPGVDIHSSLPEWSNFSGFPERLRGNWAQSRGRGDRVGHRLEPSELATVGTVQHDRLPGGRYSNDDDYTIRNCRGQPAGRSGCQIRYHMYLDTEFQDTGTT